MATRIKLSVIILLAIMLGGCANQVQSSFDKFTGVSRNQITIYGRLVFAAGVSNIELIQTKSGTTGPAVYGLHLFFTDDGDYFQGTKIIWIVDGKKFVNQGTSQLEGVSADQYSVTYNELDRFFISKEQVRAMAHAKNIQFKVYGQQSQSEGQTMVKRGRQALNHFYKQCVMGAGDGNEDKTW